MDRKKFEDMVFLQYSKVYHVEEALKDGDDFAIVNRKTGEITPIGTVMPTAMQQIANLVTQAKIHGRGYLTVGQDSEVYIAENLSDKAVRVLCYLRGKMRFENTVYGFGNVEIAKALKSSTRTVNRALQELEDKKFIKKDGIKGKRMIDINPFAGWKGKAYKQGKKFKLFFDDIKRDQDEAVDAESRAT